MQLESLCVVVAVCFAIPTYPSNGKWQISTGASSFDDSRTVIVWLDAENTISGWPKQTTRPRLVLRCFERKTEAYINLGMTTHVEISRGRRITSMRGRYDNEKSRNYVLDNSTDGKAIFFRNSVAEIKSMLDKSSAIFGVIPFNSDPVEIRFDLADISEAIKPLRRACEW